MDLCQLIPVFSCVPEWRDFILSRLRILTFLPRSGEDLKDCLVEIFWLVSKNIMACSSDHLTKAHTHTHTFTHTYIQLNRWDKVVLVHVPKWQEIFDIKCMFCLQISMDLCILIYIEHRSNTSEYCMWCEFISWKFMSARKILSRVFESKHMQYECISSVK